MATPNINRPASRHTSLKLPISIDTLAIGIALALAALIRLGVIHHISF